MIETLRSWIIGVIVAVLVCSFILEVTPDGRVKAVVRFACGIMVSIALVGIVMDFDYGSLSMYLAEYRENANNVALSAAENASKETRFIIEEKCEAYILDKAENSDISVSVSAKWSDNGYWYPYEVQISGAISESDRETLTRIIESELGVPEENQTWSTNDGD